MAGGRSLWRCRSVGRMAHGRQQSQELAPLDHPPDGSPRYGSSDLCCQRGCPVTRSSYQLGPRAEPLALVELTEPRQNTFHACRPREASSSREFCFSYWDRHSEIFAMKTVASAHGPQRRERPAGTRQGGVGDPRVVKSSPCAAVDKLHQAPTGPSPRA